MIANNIEDLIGNTPLVKINSLSERTGATILGKCEFMNPTSSVKDRIAFNMINEAMKSGRITKESTIIEPTSGNTGIGLAAVCAARGLKLILTMPDSMSIERRKLLTYLGAELVLTPAANGMNGAIEKANVLEEEIDNAIVLQQFNNADNPDIHRKTLLYFQAELPVHTRYRVSVPALYRRSSIPKFTMRSSPSAMKMLSLWHNRSPKKKACLSVSPPEPISTLLHWLRHVLRTKAR